MQQDREQDRKENRNRDGREVWCKGGGGPAVLVIPSHCRNSGEATSQAAIRGSEEQMQVAGRRYADWTGWEGAARRAATTRSQGLVGDDDRVLLAEGFWVFFGGAAPTAINVRRSGKSRARNPLRVPSGS